MVEVFSTRQEHSPSTRRWTSVPSRSISIRARSRWNTRRLTSLCTPSLGTRTTHITEVTNPHVIETGYRSPQLTLWTLGPDEWLLFLKLPDYAARKKPQRKPDVIQLPLPDLDENQRQQVSS